MSEDQTITIRITWFARLAEAAGCDHELMTVADGATIGAVLDQIRQDRPALAEALGDGRNIRAAVNEAITGNDHVLQDGDELALFPPFTGG
ncbi:MAG: molybdopterin converting factor subunit 1 [Alphaproteobacteria bacterium]